MQVKIQTLKTVFKINAYLRHIKKGYFQLSPSYPNKLFCSVNVLHIVQDSECKDLIIVAHCWYQDMCQRITNCRSIQLPRRSTPKRHFNITTTLHSAMSHIKTAFPYLTKCMGLQIIMNETPFNLISSSTKEILSGAIFAKNQFTFE